MSQKRITFFELHTHGDIQIGPGSLAGDGVPSDDASSTSDAHEPAEDTGSGGLLGLLAALAVLVVAAIAIKKLTGDDEDGGVDLAESDDL